MCVYATPIDQDYVRKVMNSAVRSSGGKRDEVVLTLTLILPPNSHPNPNSTPYPYPNQVVLGHWSFNEGAGEHCADSSANRNHATLEPTPTLPLTLALTLTFALTLYLTLAGTTPPSRAGCRACSLPASTCRPPCPPRSTLTLTPCLTLPLPPCLTLTLPLTYR